MSQREKNYDYLRSISCLAIILLHVSGSYWGVVGRESNEFVIMTIYNGCTRFAVPVFMMLSGAFLLVPEKGEDIKKCTKRFGKMLLKFYIWSAFFAFQGLVFKVITGNEITEELLSNSWERFLWGHYHMWFVFLVLGFYLLLPIASKIAENKTVLEYYLVLWIMTRFFIPAIAVGKLSWMNTWINKLDLNMLIGYLGYFVLGYYIRKYGVVRKARIAIYIGGGIGFLYSIVKTIMDSRLQEKCVENYFSPGSWNILLFSAAIFTFFTYLKKTDICYTFVEKAARYSFVIYMIHPFFLEKLNLIGIKTISFNCLFSIPILTIGIFLASYFVAFIINRIPHINKLLM